MNHSEERCRTFQLTRELSYFSASVSALLIPTTILFNTFIIVSLLKNKNLLRKSMYYKILLNMAIADFLSGAIFGPASVSFHIEEALRSSISTYEVQLLHCSLFLINNASILTIGVFCMERQVLLMAPTRFREGFSQQWHSICVILLTWLFAGLLVLPYFHIGYLRYLKIFICTSVTFSCFSIVIMISLYKMYLTLNPQIQTNRFTKQRDASKGDSDEYICCVPYKDPDIWQSTPRNQRKKCERVSSIVFPDVIQQRRLKDEKRVTKTFFMMLLVFLGTYLPAAVMTLYVNVCTKCTCLLVHTMRDLLVLTISSSATWRPLTFIFRLRTLRVDRRELTKNFRKFSVRKWF